MGKKRLNIYYAHPMSWYNTPAEWDDVQALSVYGEVTNPNNSYFEQRVQQAKASNWPIMDLFAGFIRDQADVVAFRPFRDGKLGAGVAREVLEAQIWGVEVWQLANTEKGVTVFKQALVPGQYDISKWGFNDILTVDETRARINKGVL